MRANLKHNAFEIETVYIKVITSSISQLQRNTKHGCDRAMKEGTTDTEGRHWTEQVWIQTAKQFKILPHKTLLY